MACSEYQEMSTLYLLGIDTPSIHQLVVCTIFLFSQYDVDIQKFGRFSFKH